MTPEQKAEIDAMSYHGLLQAVRFAPPGDPRFQGERGLYWMKRLAEMRAAHPGQAVADSKALGWR
jgi:hypothetical protein